jgi:hypothetical protein
MGLPIIATNWSGITAYLDESVGYPLAIDVGACMGVHMHGAVGARAHAWTCITAYLDESVGHPLAIDVGACMGCAHAWGTRKHGHACICMCAGACCSAGHRMPLPPHLAPAAARVPYTGLVPAR